MERNEGAGSVVRFGVYELDLETGHLRFQDASGKVDPLTDGRDQQSRLLVFLASRPNEPVSRQQIQQHFWPDESRISNSDDKVAAALDRRLDVLVSDLRSLLKDDTQKPRYIETIPKKGYRFVAAVEAVELRLTASEVPNGGEQSRPRDPVERLSRMTGVKRSFLDVLVGAGTALGLILLLNYSGGIRSHQAAETPAAGIQGAAPVITAVSPILPQRKQEIIIEGHGFGHYTPFNRLVSPFLAIGDDTAHWAAGRITPENADDVTLTVTNWTDTDIIITELAGDYGKKWWRLNPGDQV